MRRKYLPMLAVAALTSTSLALAAEVPQSDTRTTNTAVFDSRAQSTDGPLDLRTGDLTYILTPEQLQQALGTDHVLRQNGVPAEEQVAQIEVRATREQHTGNARSDIPFGFASFLWAFNNPAQAWRLFTPVEWEG